MERTASRFLSNKSRTLRSEASALMMRQLLDCSGPARQMDDFVYTTAVVECRVCGDEGVLAVDVVVKAAEIATFAAAHAAHDRFDIHLRLAASDGYLTGSEQHFQLGGPERSYESRQAG